MVPFGVPIIIRHLLFRVPKKGTLILTTTHICLLSSKEKGTISGPGPSAGLYGPSAGFYGLCGLYGLETICHKMS